MIHFLFDELFVFIFSFVLCIYSSGHVNEGLQSNGKFPLTSKNVSQYDFHS